MALSILDGNQSATTLSTILSSGQHITAHTVVSLGTQAITDIVNATSANLTNTQLRASAVTIGGTVTVANSLTVSDITNAVVFGISDYIFASDSFPISGTVTANPTGTQTIAGTVTIGASTAQIGSVTASISGTVPVSGTFFQATQPVSLTTLPALVAGTAQIGSVTVGNTVTIAGTVTANLTGTQTIAGSVTLGAGTSQIGSVTAFISNSVVTFYPMQGTAVSNTNFTSTTASTTLVSAVAGREVLTVFNEGAGNLHISPGATCTTISYQVRLSTGDYWECPAGQLSLAHTAVFATAGTARVTEVS